MDIGYLYLSSIVSLVEKEGDRVIWERLPYGAFVRKPVKQAVSGKVKGV